MLLNPYQVMLETLPGSRILRDALSLGLIGATIDDPRRRGRTWQILNLYAPIEGRWLGGIRARLMDQKRFTTFCNQRDLELLLGLAKPGDLCLWLDRDYPELDSREFFGLCADEEDLDDDLLEWELLIRNEHPGVLPWGMEFTRRIHVSSGVDAEEVNMMLYDCDPHTGLGPDMNVHTIRHRWVSQGRDKVRWDRIQLS